MKKYILILLLFVGCGEKEKLSGEYKYSLVEVRVDTVYTYIAIPFDPTGDSILWDHKIRDIFNDTICYQRCEVEK